MNKILIVWRRLGKEHGENMGFRLNDEDIIERHLQEKITAFKQTPVNKWRWWQINDDLLIETKAGEAVQTIYYLPRHHWVILHFPQGLHLEEEWEWYVHIGDIAFTSRYNCWVFTDLFCDVVVKSDLRTYRVLDMEEAILAQKMELISMQQLAQIQHAVQCLIELIMAESFPPPDIKLDSTLDL
jgi:hypothetical protein